jgi:hypothetical protein
MPEEETADALRFRREFGLDDSLEHITRVQRDPSAVMDYGVPLLPEEVATIESRSTVAERAMPTIEAYGAAHADQYGGAYLDHERAGVIVTLWTGSIRQHARGLWAELWDVAPATPLSFQLVRHTLADLEELQSRITVDIDAWRAAGIEVTAVLLDTVNNRVEVGVADPQAGAGDRLLQEYGADWIRVTPMEGGTAP